MASDRYPVEGYDGKGAFRVNVTRTDIDHAERESSSRCVVANAIYRSIPGATFVDVNQQTTRFTWRGRRYLFLTPNIAQWSLVAFDAGHKQEPFRFSLRDAMYIKIRPTAVARRARVGKQTFDDRSTAAKKGAATRAAKRAAAKATAADPLPAHGTVAGMTVDRSPVSRQTRSFGIRRMRANQPVGPAHPDFPGLARP